MKVLVAGSRGYCGLGIVRALLEHGHQVLGFDRSPLEAQPDSDRHEEILGDITDLEFLFRAVEGCQAVVNSSIYRDVAGNEWKDSAHQAPISSFVPHDLLTYQVNTAGTMNLLEAARQYGLQRAVLLSSARVVWDHFVSRDQTVIQTDLRVTANSPLNYSDMYGFSKHLQELVGKYYADEYGLPVIIFRPWWVVDGPENRNRYGQSLADDPIPLSPTGMVCRYDLGEACALALEHPEIRDDIFYPVAGPGCERYFDVEHLHRTLGWQPRYTFQDLARS